jgi:trehalose 6-phosphate phosphatase
VAESTRRPDAPLDDAISLVSSILGERPAGLLTDFDGTISPIVADPALSRLVDGAGGALAALAERLAVVAVVTGRAPLDARRMTDVPGLLIAGNHGTEWLEPNAGEPVTAPAASSVRADIDAALSALPELPGVTVEHKGISATVHYRNAPDPDRVLPAILDGLGALEGRRIELRHGRMSVELRPVGFGDKGTAARAVIERFGLRGVVVMGDDLTDLDMFRAVAELRAEHRIRGVIIGVGGADASVPAAASAGSARTTSEASTTAALLVAVSR